MQKRIFVLLLCMIFILMSGCTKATEDRYEKYYELVPIIEEDVSSEDTSSEDTSSENISSEYVTSEDIPSEDTSSEEVSSKDTSSKDTSSEDVSSEDDENKTKPVKNLNIKDFGAKGDGVTDDTLALKNAVNELVKCGPGSTLNFEEGKTYYAGSLPDEAVLDLKGATGVVINGNGSTILSEGIKRYMNVLNTDGCTIQGLSFDLRIRAHFVGTVIAKDENGTYFDVISDRDIEFDGEYSLENSGFCVIPKAKTTRTYVFINKIATIDKNSRSYRVYIKPGNELSTDTNFKNMELNSEIIVPTPYIGHQGNRSFSIMYNNNLTLKNLNVYNSPYLCFISMHNTGTLTFDKVNVAPPKDEKVIFASWRDTFFCPSNSASIIWKDCVAKGGHDDIMNSFSYQLYVDKVYSNNEISCYWKDGGGAFYEDVKPGAKIVIWDEYTGKLIGRTTVKEVASTTKNRYILADELPELSTGENIKVAFENLCGPDSQVINCDFEGTIRFKGPVKIVNTKLSLYKMWIQYETEAWEGPIPNNVTFENCEFDIYGGKESLLITSRNSFLYEEGIW